MKEFDGKIALVTGSSGIGLGAALHFAREGACVYLCGIDEAVNAAALQEAAGVPLQVARIDVSDAGQVVAWVDACAIEAGGIDILVNAAAIQTYGTTATTAPADFARTIAVNLTSCYLTTHFAYRHLKARGGGAVVHVSSVQGHANQNNVLAYATSKGGVHAMTRAMAVDAARDGIRVNSISPGSVRTPLLEYSARQIAGEDASIEEAIAEFGRAHPIGRVGTVAETSALIAFLCSDKAGFCTGGDYLVDGGLTAHLGV